MFHQNLNSAKSDLNFLHSLLSTATNIGSSRVSVHYWNTPDLRAALVDRPQMIHRDLVLLFHSRSKLSVSTLFRLTVIDKIALQKHTWKRDGQGNLSIKSEIWKRWLFTACHLFFLCLKTMTCEASLRFFNLAWLGEVSKVNNNTVLSLGKYSKIFSLYFSVLIDGETPNCSVPWVHLQCSDEHLQHFRADKIIER